MSIKYKTVRLFLHETMFALVNSCIFFIANYLLFSNSTVYNTMRGKYLSFALKTHGKIESCGKNAKFLLGDSYPIIKGNVKVGNNVRFKSVKSDPIIIGSSSIGDNCEFHSPVQIGDGVFFNLNCSIFGYTTIGNNCSFGPNVLVVSYTHKIGNQKRRADTPLFPRITIKDGVWIGAGAIILGGVTIGEGAVIGAGAVVIEDVPPNTLAAGVPAKIIKKLNNTS